MAVVTVEEALQLWEEGLRYASYKVEMIDVKSAKGYVLAEEIVAPTDVPDLFEISDGWVCHCLFRGL